jgi:sec-independent protein translocase protein TatB
MFNLSFGELIVLSAIGLIVIGPKQLPQIAKVIAKTLGEIRRAMNEVKTSMKTEFMKDDSKPKSKHVVKEEEVAGGVTKNDNVKKDNVVKDSVNNGDPQNG